MFAAILIILILPFVDINKIKSSQFKPYNKFIIYSLVAVFILLGVLGGCHPTNTVSTVGLIGTILYFSIFGFSILMGSLLENTMIEISKLFNGVKGFDKSNIKKVLTKSSIKKSVRNYSTSRKSIEEVQVLKWLQEYGLEHLAYQNRLESNMFKAPVHLIPAELLCKYISYMSKLKNHLEFEGIDSFNYEAIEL